MSGLASALAKGEVAKVAELVLPLCDAERGRALLADVTPRPGELLRALETLRRSDLADATTLAPLARSLQKVTRAWLPGRALSIAASAHEAQQDKGGAPYVLHPMRLALRASSSEELMVAALHDVIEDTPWTLERLWNEGFPERVLSALDALTKREGESYEVFLERVLVDRLAMRVKLWDLEDNMDLKRLPSFTDADKARLEKYHRARKRLERALETHTATRPGKLAIELVPESVERVRALAIYSEVRADHVTLKHGFDRPFEASWIPGGLVVGDHAVVHAKGLASDDRIQALLVEVCGLSKRPADGGALHVTVSRKPWARSRDSNVMLLRAKPSPVDFLLEGVIVRDDDG